MAAQVIHVEVTGSDGDALQRFYRDVFGWNLDTNNPGGYGMYRQDNGITGGIGAAGNGQPPRRQALRPHRQPPGGVGQGRGRWRKGTAAPDRGRGRTTIALFADPEGHIVGIM